MKCGGSGNAIKCGGSGKLRSLYANAYLGDCPGCEDCWCVHPQCEDGWIITIDGNRMTCPICDSCEDCYDPKKSWATCEKCGKRFNIVTGSEMYCHPTCHGSGGGRDDHRPSQARRRER